MIFSSSFFFQKEIILNFCWFHHQALLSFFQNLYLIITFSAYPILITLFRNERFALNDMFHQRNVSNFAIISCSIRKPRQFFICFSFHATLLFPFINALVYVDKGIHEGKTKVAQNEKRRKLHMGFMIIHKIQQILKHFVGPNI